MFSLPARFPIFALGFLFAVTLYAPAKQAQKATIERIEIRGYQRYPEDVLRSYVKSKPGDICDEERLRLDLSALYETGLFEKIEISEKDGHTGKVVTFQVREKPVIRVIEFVGFKSLRSPAIEAYFKEHKIDFRVESLYDAAKLESAERALDQMIAQQGRHPGKVRTEIKQIPPTSIGVRFIFEEENKATPKH
jgi:outer membrane protein insertion porin family